MMVDKICRSRLICYLLNANIYLLYSRGWFDEGIDKLEHGRN